MDLIKELLKEFEMEAQTTRKMLPLVPANKFDWAPHEKSMKLKALATHLAEIAGWPTMMLENSELDFAKMDGYKPTEVNSTDELLALFEKSYEQGKTAIQNANENMFDDEWILRTGDKIHMKMTKYESLRHAFSQTIHHRAQLGVFLRLLDIPIPGSYGPSADDMQTFG